MAIIYIYVLVDPRTDEVRYVGRTADPTARLNSHKRLHSRNDRKDAWVAELLDEGLEPEMRVIEETASKEASRRELCWQEYYEAAGSDMVGFNPRKQADVLRARPDVREKWRQMMIERWKDPAWQEKMRAVHTGAIRPDGVAGKFSVALTEAHRRKREANGGTETLTKHTPMITGLLDPQGNPVEPFNHIRKFCEAHGLCSSTLGAVIRGKKPHHRGYRMSADI